MSLNIKLLSFWSRLFVCSFKLKLGLKKKRERIELQGFSWPTCMPGFCTSRTAGGGRKCFWTQEFFCLCCQTGPSMAVRGIWELVWARDYFQEAFSRQPPILNFSLISGLWQLTSALGRVLGYVSFDCTVHSPCSGPSDKYSTVLCYCTANFCSPDCLNFFSFRGNRTCVLQLFASKITPMLNF